MRIGTDIGTVRAGEGWEPVVKFPQFHEVLVLSFSTAAKFVLKKIPLKPMGIFAPGSAHA